jgi:hypothetical protein
MRVRAPLGAPAALSAAWLLALACAGAPPPSEDAQLSVEVLSGFAGGPGPGGRPPGPEAVEILVDVTSSMGQATAAGPPRDAASRGAAARLIRALPAEHPVGLHAVGFARVEGCQPAFRLDGSAPGAARDALLRQLDGLDPAGEGSLARALDGLRVFLAVSDRLADARIVVLTDLGDECGGDLCEVVSDALTGGARLEFVLFGDRDVPACLEEIAPAWETAATPPPAFRVEAGEGTSVAEGRAGGAPVPVAPGLVWVQLSLEPPLRVGPLRLSPGRTTRLRVLDFPALDPPVREWAWETLEGHPGTAAATHASGSGAAP